MNESYPAKTAYKNCVASREYDTRRFKSLKGRYMDKREKTSLMGAVEHLLAKNYGQKAVLALDAPCGTGRITEVILDMGIPAVGVDISFQMLHEAKQKLSPDVAHKAPLIGLVQCDMKNLPFRDNAFSITSCVRLMGHLPRKTRYNILCELLMVSRQGAAITFYRSGIRHKVKRLVKRLMGNRAPWYPMSHIQVLKLAQECSASVYGRFYVHRMISDGVTYALTSEK